MADDQWWKDDSEEEVGAKEKVEDLLNDAEIKRLEREEELAQAEHEAKLAALREKESQASGIPLSGAPDETLVEVFASGAGGDVDGDGILSDREKDKIAKETGGGVFGLWWLSKGEAFSIGVAAMLSVFFFGMGTIVASGESEWLTTEAEILESYPGFDWIEYEDCYEDSWGDTYCDYWYELECWADIDVSYAVASSEYTAEVDRYPITTLGDYEGAEDDCMQFEVNEAIPIGSTVTLYYDTEDPADIRTYPPSDVGVIIFFCCLPIFLLILIVTIVNARFSNAPKYVYAPSSGGQSHHDGSNVVHHHHHGGFGGGRWGPRFYFGRPSRGGRIRSRSRRVSSGGGRRSGGGGGRRSGGGRRR